MSQYSQNIHIHDGEEVDHKPVLLTGCMTTTIATGPMSVTFLVYHPREARLLARTLREMAEYLEANASKID